MLLSLYGMAGKRLTPPSTLYLHMTHDKSLDIMDNVILNVYDLLPTAPNQTNNASSSQTSSFSRFFSNILSPLGMGAYHTSIDVRGE